MLLYAIGWHSVHFCPTSKDFSMRNIFNISPTLISIIVFLIAGDVVNTCGKIQSDTSKCWSSNCIISSQCITSTDWRPLSSAIVTTFLLLIQGPCFIGVGSYIACILPFIRDQLIGASGKQFSFVMYWMVWGKGLLLLSIQYYWATVN